ncbi:DUF5057 domain-containing protein [bacterium]|nr:DUF5057 domain-containing protein [bacterium]
MKMNLFYIYRSIISALVLCLILFSTSNALVHFSFTEQNYDDFIDGDAHNIDILTPDPLGVGDGAIQQTANDTIRVLQIYPDGHCVNCISNAVYDHAPSGSPPLNFHIDILQVSVFNTATSVTDSFEVMDPSTGRYTRHSIDEYDILIFGVANGFGDYDLSSNSAAVVRQFAQMGRGILFTHDTIGEANLVNHENFNSLTDVSGLTTEWELYTPLLHDFTHVYRVEGVPDDPVLHRPFDIPEDFPVTLCHRFGQRRAYGTTWYVGRPLFGSDIYMHTFHNTTYNSYSGFFSYGHDEEEPLEWEAKAMINTMYYSYFGGRGTGFYFSNIYNLGCEVEMDTVTWIEAVPGMSSMTLGLRSSYDSLTWTDWRLLTNGEPPPPAVRNGIFFQYGVVTTRGGTGELPTLSSITFNYWRDTPSLELLEPAFNTLSACTCQTISFRVTTDSDLAPETARIMIDSLVYGGEYFEYYPGEELLVFEPDGFGCWHDNQLVTGEIFALSNTHGCGMLDTIAFVFRADYSAPVYSMLEPPPDTVISDRYPNISFHIEDSIGNVHPNSIILSVDGENFTHHSPHVIWRGGDFIFLTEDVGLELGDTVEVCLLDAADNPDYCEPNHIRPYCWVFYIDTEGPEADIISPTDSGYISCETLMVEILLRDWHGIDPSSIVIYVAGRTYNYPDYMELSDTVLIFNPPLVFTDGEVVDLMLESVQDILGNPSGPFTWTMTFDQFPPDVFDESPRNGIIIGEAYPEISISIVDYLSGVDPSSIVLSINGSAYYPPDVLWDGEDVSFLTADHGIEFFDGDSVEVCLTVSDNAQVCGANVREYCWYFEVNLSGPITELLEPDHSSVTACDSQDIYIRLIDPNGVVESSIILLYEEEEYTTSSSNLEFEDTVLVFHPPDSWENGDTVHISILEAEDSLGNPLAEVTLWEFVVDLSPPVFSNEQPHSWAIVDTTQPLIAVDIVDSIAGVDTATIYLYVHGEVIQIGDDGVTWDGERLEFDPAIYGVDFADVETLEICVEAADAPDWCEHNARYWCWYILIDLAGPRARIIQPLENTYTACSLQVIEIMLQDPTGILEASVGMEIQGTALDLGDSRLSFTNDTLRFVPAVPWQNGDIINVGLFTAQDSLGNPLRDTLNWVFYTDFQGPFASNPQPVTGTATYNWQELVSVCLFDSLSGVDSNSIVLHINDSAFYIDNSAVTWDGETLYFDPFMIGYFFHELDTIAVSVDAGDSPDYCDPNMLENALFEWWFNILDDDTIRPSFLGYEPLYWAEDSSFNLYAALHDSSGLYSAPSTVDTQCAYIYWDNDGELEITHNTAYARFDNNSGDTVWFRSITQIPPQTEDADFLFKVVFWDDDHDFCVGDRRCNQSEELNVHIIPRLRAEIIEPLPNTTTSCTDQEIIIGIESRYTLNEEMIRLMVNDSVYSIEPPHFEIEEDSLLIWRPHYDFEEGPVDVELYAVHDIYDIPLAYPISWRFYVDVSPPELLSYYPEDGEMVHISDFWFSAEIADFPSGIDVSSFDMRIMRHGGVGSFDISNPGVTWTVEDSISGEFRFDPDAANFPYSDGDSFTVLLSVQDSVDYCSPNVAEWEFFFWLEPEFECQESTDPFTPNLDSYNDYVIFTYPGLFSENAKLEIYDMYGHKVYSRDIEKGVPESVRWDGVDDNGRKCSGGVYMYLIKVGGDKVCKGTITLVR